jgi:hypothetical protein
MPRYAPDDHDRDDGAAGVIPGVYASLLPWAQAEYARSGDPRWRYYHDDGEGGLCRVGHGCGHGDPPPDPGSSQCRMLDALEAGEPVVVRHWTASGHRWIGGGHGWSGPLFTLPWDGRAVRHVRVLSDDTVQPVARTRRI